MSHAFCHQILNQDTDLFHLYENPPPFSRMQLSRARQQLRQVDVICAIVTHVPIVHTCRLPLCVLMESV